MPKNASPVCGEKHFSLDGCHFVCTVTQVGADLFQPHVRYEAGLPDTEPTDLQDDVAPYRTLAEAWRHAEQQATRWTHDQQANRTGRM